MSSGYWPMNADIRQIFLEETVNAGGIVMDTFDDGNRLFTRSVMPDFNEIIPGDSVKGGVALRSNAEEIWIHPYILRVICTNGSIRPLSVQSTHITRREGRESYSTERKFTPYLRNAIRKCLDKTVLQNGVDEMREARSKGIDSAEKILETIEYLHANLSSSYMMKIAPTLVSEALDEIETRIEPLSRVKILVQHALAGDSTLYGLMNAVTSLARDIENPEERWKFEEMGGMIPLIPYPFVKQSGDHALGFHSDPFDSRGSSTVSVKKKVSLTSRFEEWDRHVVAECRSRD